MTSAIRCGVLTVSDRCSRGQADDRSGPAVADMVIARVGATVVHRDCVPDEAADIERVVRGWVADGVDLVLTTGGTGLAPRDVTPEAAARIIERPVPGLMELARAQCASKTRLTFLSRGVAGVTRSTLIITLPGSLAGATETLDAMADLLSHAIELIRGEDPHPSTPSR